MELQASAPIQGVSIFSLLERLRKEDVSASTVTADELALAVSYIFTGQLDYEQTRKLLLRMNETSFDQHSDVLAKCAAEMRAGAVPVKTSEIMQLVEARTTTIGNYHGGPCDIVGTGGDNKQTFNISTASSIVASSLLLMAKHGNRASTSLSGSADLLQNLRLPGGNAEEAVLTPSLEAVTPSNLLTIYKRTNYAFLFAPLYHFGMRHAKAAREDLKPRSTIFNLLGPLANPLDSILEARVIGVKNKSLGPIFAEALRLTGVVKAMVVCGDEDMDEISCAGMTHCWRLSAASEVDSAAEVTNNTSNASHKHKLTTSKIQYFTIHPDDFGLPTHPLIDVAPGGSPSQNAETLLRLLQPKSASNSGALEIKTLNAIKDFVLLNTASLLVISGVCDGDTSPFSGAIGDSEPVITEVGPGGGRWKEGVRVARKAIESGLAMSMLRKFALVTSELSAAT